jgi:hypothetical protein
MCCTKILLIVTTELRIHIPVEQIPLSEARNCELPWKKRNYWKVPLNCNEILKLSIHYHNIIFNLLVSWSSVRLEKLPVPRLLKTFPVLYGTRRFIIVLTKAIHRSLSWTRSISPYNIRFRGFRLTQHRFNSCLLFYSNWPLHVSVARPSSEGH